MNEEELNPLSPSRYICNDVIGDGEQESKQVQGLNQKNNNTTDNGLVVELVKPTLRIFASEKEVNDYLDSLSLDEVGSAEHWFRWCVKKAREKLFDKKFQVKRSTFEQHIAPYIQEELAEIQQQKKAQQQAHGIAAAN